MHLNQHAGFSSVSFLSFLLLMSAAAPAAPQPSALRVVDALPAERAVMFDGRVVELPAERVWKPICGSDTTQLNGEQFRGIVDAARAVADAPPADVVDTASAGGGFNIVFSIGTGLPPGAAAALASIEAYLESQFTDPVTVTISFGMQNMGAGVLGATSSNYVSNVPWADVRDGLRNGMDPDDTIQDFVPDGSTIPVRYDASTSTITNENRVFVTRANFNASIGTVGGTACSMTLNTNFGWDYDPSDGVGGYDFQGVVAHEVGHGLGFVSGVDFRSFDIETLDVFRFQLTDGTGDWNPDTLNEFRTRARTIDNNNPNDDANSDLITEAFRMEDGNPRQASHFHDNMGIGIMDPTAASGETFYPNFFRHADQRMFDAIGWDFVDCNNNFAPDQLDLVQGIAEDDNANGRLDECERNAPLSENGGGTCGFCLAQSTCIDGSCYSPKNRYISVRPGNPSSLTALRVTDVGSARRWWVGEPDATGIAALVDQAEFRDWSLFAETIHIGGCGIAPGGTLQVQSLLDIDDPGNEAMYSPAVTLPTVNQWGDVIGTNNELRPDGVANFTDISAVVECFRLVATALPVVRCDLHDVSPDGVANFQDITLAVDAFRELPYPFAAPIDCP